MISALTGELRRVEPDRIHVQCGPILYELLVPAADISELQAGLGELMTFHTILYLEGDPSRGGLEPRLIGFIRPTDRAFFERFTTVKGIGPRTALKALTVPVGQIAEAIESRDSRFLVALKGIGKRTAELIIAELSGKVRDFATGRGQKAPVPALHSPAESDAIAALITMGLQRPEAQRLLERARQSTPEPRTTDSLLREMLRLRTVRV